MTLAKIVSVFGKIAGGAAAASLFMSGCGEAAKQNKTQFQLQSWKPQTWEQRISKSELEKIYSTATEERDGKVYPKSNPPMTTQFKSNAAPSAFKAEWGELTAGTELKGYINTGYVVTSGWTTRLAKLTQTVSEWNNIKDPKGNSIFRDVSSLDSDGNKSDDQNDGAVSADGRNFNLELSIQTPVGFVPMTGVMTQYSRDDNFQLDLTNTREISLPIVGTLVKKNKLNVHLKFYAHEKGWVVYGASAVKMETQESAFNEKDLNRIMEGIFNWLLKNLIVSKS